MFSSKITTTCLMGYLVFFAVTTAGRGAEATTEAARAADVGGGAAASDPGVSPRTRAVRAPAEAHRPMDVPTRRGMSGEPFVRVPTGVRDGRGGVPASRHVTPGSIRCPYRSR